MSFNHVSHPPQMGRLFPDRGFDVAFSQGAEESSLRKSRMSCSTPETADDRELCGIIFLPCFDFHSHIDIINLSQPTNDCGTCTSCHKADIDPYVSDLLRGSITSRIW